MRVGGLARVVIFPRSQEELVRTLDICASCAVKRRVIGRGSNVLFLDQGFDGAIIRLGHMNTIDIGARQITAEAGITNQAFIRAALLSDLGGIEFLASVPGTLGGAVYMNAGRGRGKSTVGDFIRCVRYLHSDGTIREYMAPECAFGYRMSVFQEMDGAILAATLELPRQSRKTGRLAIRERMAFTRRTQDSRWPSLGTIFRSGFSDDMAIREMRCGGAAWSKKTPNWIVNLDSAGSADIQKLISRAIRSHAERKLKVPNLEIEVADWDYQTCNGNLGDYEQ